MTTFHVIRDVPAAFVRWGEYEPKLEWNPKFDVWSDDYLDAVGNRMDIPLYAALTQPDSGLVEELRDLMDELQDINMCADDDSPLTRARCAASLSAILAMHGSGK